MIPVSFDLERFKAGTPGIYPSIENDVYHGGPGISKSRLSLMQQSPMHFQKGKASEETSAMIIGTMAHSGILEGKWGLPANVGVTPEGADFRKKEWKDWKAAEIAKGFKRFIKASEVEDVKCMAQAIAEHPEARELFAVEAFAELSMLAEFDVMEGRNPVLLRVRHDWFPKGNIPLTADLKTTMNASPDEFYNDILNHGYHLSAFLYLTVCALLGVRRDLYVFAAVEKRYPHGIHLCYIERGSREWDLAERQCMKLLRQYVECRYKGEWPGYPLMRLPNGCLNPKAKVKFKDWAYKADKEDEKEPY